LPRSQLPHSQARGKHNAPPVLLPRTKPEAQTQSNLVPIQSQLGRYGALAVESGGAGPKEDPLEV
jgi:hypothetical protein